MPQSSQTKQRRGRPAEPLDQRILRLADRSGECWLWTGRLDRDGYGRITVSQRPHRVHRVSYETFVGPIPPGMEIDHLCRVRHCVNPEHLEPVPHRTNVIRSFQAAGFDAPPSCAHPDIEITFRADGTRNCRACRRANYLRRHGVRKHRAYTNHRAIAQQLRQTGEFLLVATCHSAGAASHMAYYMRTGRRISAYRPAGSFDAEYRKVDGEFRVYARYVGQSPAGGAR